MPVSTECAAALLSFRYPSYSFLVRQENEEGNEEQGDDGDDDDDDDDSEDDEVALGMQ